MIPALAGLVLGLSIGFFYTLVARALTDVVADPDPEADVGLWHGPTAPLGLTVLTAAMGTALFLNRQRIDMLLQRVRHSWRDPFAGDGTWRRTHALARGWLPTSSEPHLSQKTLVLLWPSASEPVRPSASGRWASRWGSLLAFLTRRRSAYRWVWVQASPSALGQVYYLALRRRWGKLRCSRELPNLLVGPSWTWTVPLRPWRIRKLPVSVDERQRWVLDSHPGLHHWEWGHS